MWAWIIILRGRSFVLYTKLPCKLADCDRKICGPKLVSIVGIPMYIWIASDWYSVSAQQVGGQVHRTHCLALKSWGCLLQQPIIQGITLADLTGKGGGVVESSKYDLNPTWWIIVL